jgi:hypothetical protein
MAGLHTGCVGERHQMTLEEQKAFLAEQQAQHEQDLAMAKAEAQGLTLEQLQDKEKAE